MCQWYEELCSQMYLPQYADDSTICRHCKGKDIKSCANILTSKISHMLPWSSSNNPAFNAAKTKAMLFTTS